MKTLIENLYRGDDNLDLYLSTIEAVEGITRHLGPGRWLDIVGGDTVPLDETNQALVDAGLLGLAIPEEHGGMGGGMVGPSLVIELCSRYGLLTFQTILTFFARHPIVAHGTDAQIEKYVGPTLRGEKTFCILATEADAGTNTFNVTTRATRDGEGWVLNGQKTWISAANASDYGFLIAKTDIGHPRALSIFVIDMKAHGVSMTRLNANVFPAEDQFSVFFDNVELPEDALIGQEGQGAKYMFEGLNPERFVVAALALGMGDLALRMSKDYLCERAPFGAPIGSYQAVQHPLARNKANLDAARLTLYYAAKLYDQGEEAGAQANAAKYLASVAACQMADDAIQFHGGNGMDDDTGLMAIWKMCRLARIAPINNEMVLNYIAQKDIGLPRSY